MTSWHRVERYALRAVILACFGLLPLGLWAAAGVPAPAVASARKTGVEQPGKYPSQVLILRHAEKPDNDDDPHLTSRGAARAAALPSLFLIPPTFPTKPAPFAVPDFLFAAEESKHSNRPVETITPLSKVLGDQHIHHKHKDDDFQAVADELFSDGKYAGKTVLICWHHGKIPKLTRAILDKATNAATVKDQVPKHWADTVFDRVWQITFDGTGQASFNDRPQRLLFNDQAK
jgi:hypothetical protein